MLRLRLVVLLRSGGFLENARAITLQIGVKGVNQTAALVCRQPSLYQIGNLVGFSLGYFWPSCQVTEVLQRFYRCGPVIRLSVIRLLAVPAIAVLLRLLLLMLCWRRHC